MAGCASGFLKPEFNRFKSYNLNQIIVTNVGNPMIITQEGLQRKCFEPITILTLKCFGSTERVQPGNCYDIHVLGNGNYEFQFSEVGIEVDKNGFYVGRTTGFGSTCSLTSEKKSKIFNIVDQFIEDDYGNGFRTEILYSGKSSDTIRLLYREFKYDLARPAFYQELTYNLDESKNITFKNFKFTILEATNSYIKFIVDQDIAPSPITIESN